MAQTTTQQRTQAPQTPISKGQVAVLAPPRLPPPEQGILQEYGVDLQGWRVLVESIFPGAKTPMAVMMALDYCKRRKLDVYKHPVHIVAVWNSSVGEKGAMVETIWPGINELRTTAIRTGQYAGMDVPVFGPIIDHLFEGKIKKWANGGASWEKVEARVSFPEWCQITVFRVLGGNRVPFPGPRVYWLETYARIRNDCDVPNSMWEKRPSGQIEKCAEAAALRRAFPEEIGSDYSIDEIGAFTTHAPTDVTDQGTATVSAEEPRRDDPRYQSQPDASASLATPAGSGQPGNCSPGAGGDSKPEAASTPASNQPATEAAKSDKPTVTDVVDQNEQKPVEEAEPAEQAKPAEPMVSFQEYKRAGDWFIFADEWLDHPSRIESELVAFSAFYNDWIQERLSPSWKSQSVREAVKDTMERWNAAMKRAQAKAKAAL